MNNNNINLLKAGTIKKTPVNKNRNGLFGAAPVAPVAPPPCPGG